MRPWLWWTLLALCSASIAAFVCQVVLTGMAPNPNFDKMVYRDASIARTYIAGFTAIVLFVIPRLRPVDMNDSSSSISLSTSSRRFEPGGEPLAAAAGSGSTCPPTVTRGANKGLSVDWLRVVCPVASIDAIREALETTFGESTERKGRYFHDCGTAWADGVGLYWSADDAVRHCVVELPGAALATMEAPSRRSFARLLLSLGGVCSRLDVALDMGPEHAGLIQSAWDACEAGELVGARTYARVESSSEAGRGVTVSIGKRGSHGSGRYVRIYDKGVETGTEASGEWTRYEAEFSADCAADVCMAWVEGGDNALRSYALGAVDFREVRRGETAIARRPRCQWWTEFLQDTDTVRTVSSRPSKTLERLSAWWDRSVMPSVVTTAEREGMGVDDVVEFIVGRLSLDSREQLSDASLALMRALKERQCTRR